MRSVKKLKCGSNTVRDGPAVHSNDTQAEQGEGGRSEADGIVVSMGRAAARAFLWNSAAHATIGTH